MEPTKRRPGRPRKKKAEGQKIKVSTQIDKEIFDAIEEECKQPGKTRSNEIARRLKASFAYDEKKISEVFGSEERFALMMMINEIISAASLVSGSNPETLRSNTVWRDSPFAAAVIRAGANEILNAFLPKEGPPAPSHIHESVQNPYGHGFSFALGTIARIVNAPDEPPLSGNGRHHSNQMRTDPWLKSALGPELVERLRQYAKEN